MSLKIDKRVRDGLLDQMKNDRKELLAQLQSHVETMTKQSREIGQMETRLELSAPTSTLQSDDDNLPPPNNPDHLKCTGKGDNDANHHYQYGV